MEMSKCPNGQEVSQSLLINFIPAVTENRQDCDVGKSSKIVEMFTEKQ